MKGLMRHPLPVRTLLRRPTSTSTMRTATEKITRRDGDYAVCDMFGTFGEDNAGTAGNEAVKRFLKLLDLKILKYF